MKKQQKKTKAQLWTQILCIALAGLMVLGGATALALQLIFA